MDHHPIILEQGIEPLAILHLWNTEIIGAAKDRRIGGKIHLTYQDKGIKAYLIAKEIEAHDHRRET